MDTKSRKPYPSDLSDEAWALLEPLLPPPFSVGAPRRTDLREVLDAIFYVLSTGCAWSALPHGSLDFFNRRVLECTGLPQDRLYRSITSQL